MKLYRKNTFLWHQKVKNGFDTDTISRVTVKATAARPGGSTKDISSSNNNRNLL